ncbi:MAG: hypothetical protein JXP34_23645 [Planctomycetes bacterium]|nr:hypothetical protein [Planctomycetota bacterium]
MRSGIVSGGGVILPAALVFFSAYFVFPTLLLGVGATDYAPPGAEYPTFQEVVRESGALGYVVLGLGAAVIVLGVVGFARVRRATSWSPPAGLLPADVAQLFRPRYGIARAIRAIGNLALLVAVLRTTMVFAWAWGFRDSTVDSSQQYVVMHGISGSFRFVTLAVSVALAAHLASYLVFALLARIEARILRDFATGDGGGR